LKSISDVLYKNNNFKVTVTIFGDDSKSEISDNSSSSNSKFKRSELIKVKNDTIYLDTFNRTIIGFLVFKKDEEGFQKPSDSIYFSQKSFVDLFNAMNICSEWLRSKNFKYLFDVDSDGKVKGLGGDPPYCPAVFKNYNEYIRFHPAVVKDYNGVSYEGISIKTQRGHFNQFTCVDFLYMASSIKAYMNNIYIANMQLISLANRLLE